MSARRKARKRALDVLFAADVRGVSIDTVFDEEMARDNQHPERFSPNDYARVLVEGVAGHLDQIDHRLRSIATDWPLERLAAVDRAILRVAAYEIDYLDDIPTAVAVSEAGELADELSTDDSRAFVQGVLGALAKTPPPEPPVRGDDAVNQSAVAETPEPTD